MKAVVSTLFLLSLSGPLGVASQTTPITKVVQLLKDLEAKVTKDGEASKQLYEEYAAWCEDRAANLDFEIKTGESQVASLQATIDREAALISSLSTKVEELTSTISTDDADLKAATDIRHREASDFATAEKDLTEVADTLRRAISVLEREMRKAGASMVELRSARSLADALRVMVQSSLISTADASRLTALVQTQSDDSEGDLALGAPDVASYESHSSGIIKTLQGLLDQAEDQLSEARKRETADRHSFELLQQSLEDGIKVANKELNEAKQGIAASSESRAAAEGDLQATSKELQSDITARDELHHDCATKSQDYEAEVKSRAEELSALAQARKIVEDSSSGAASLSYGLNQVSLLQVRARMSSGADLAHFEAVHFVRDLARKFRAPALAQLAANMAAATQVGERDPFAKVKKLISDMIDRLEQEAGLDASHKAYCDKELAESTSSKEEKTTKVEKLTTKIDQMSARSAQLKEEVGALQSSLAALAKSQAEMDAQRQKEHQAFVAAKADLEQGLQGIRLALKVLRDYYGKADKSHAAGEDAATGIIGLMQVVEADFSKGLAEAIATEESAQVSYVQQSKDNEIEKTTKQQDVAYKSAEASGLDKSISEASSDRSGVQAELNAVLEYLSKLEAECTEKAEPYEERKQRREGEIAGLKSALATLQGEAVLLQRSSKRLLRPVQPHRAA